MSANCDSTASLRGRAFCRRCLRRFAARLKGDESGSALVEMAIVVPIFFIITFGMCSFGILMNQYLQLTEATNIGGKEFSVSRNTYSDPCAKVYSIVSQTSPYLDPTKMTFSFTVNNGTPYTFAAGTSPTCTAAATTMGGLDPTTAVPLTLSISYPGSVLNMSFESFGFAPLASGFKLNAQITEIMQ